jgi:hypothetical protein
MNDISALQKLLREINYIPEISKVQSIPISQIVDPQLIAPDPIDNTSERSLEPLITYEHDGKFHIVDGYKRYQSLKSNNSPFAFGTIITPKPDTLQAGMLRIILNNKRGLSLKEKLHYLSWIKNKLSTETYIQMTEYLKISAKERYDLEKNFNAPESIIKKIEEGILDLSVSPDLIRLNESDQSALISFFSRLPLSKSNQREFIDWLPEISYRDNMSITHLVNMNEIIVLLNDKKLNGPQKIQKIRDHFYCIRFPNLSEDRKYWNSLSRRLNPDSRRVHFTPSEAFEKNRLEIKITLGNPDDALTIFEKLKNISLDEWKELIYPAKHSE